MENREGHFGNTDLMSTVSLYNKGRVSYILYQNSLLPFYVMKHESEFPLAAYLVHVVTI